MQTVPRKLALNMALDPADVPRMRRYLTTTLGADKPARQTLVSVYFDTPDLRLQDAGLSLCLRRYGRRTVQTIQASNGASSGHNGHIEIERQVRGMRPDLAAAQDTALARLLNGMDPEALRPVFATRIRRCLYQVGTETGTVALALDQGDIDTGPDRTPVSEMQFELVEGKPADLFHIARSLAAVAPMRLMVHSRAERGSALVEGEPHPVEWASDVHLDPSMTCVVGFRAIAQSCLRQIVANEAATRVGEVEGLHQMRVGLRRLRAAITVFSAITADAERERIKDELRWLSGVLGAARDLDVLIGDVLVPMRDEHPDKPAFARICREFEGRRARAYEAVASAVDSARYRTLLLDTMEWIESGPWCTDGDPLLQMRREQPVTTLAVDQLSRRYRKLVKRGKNLRRRTAEEQHMLRIRGKKLRYATEFFGELFPGKRTARRCEEALAALKELQDSLGGLNDIVTRERIALQIAEEGQAADPASKARTFAAGIIVGAQESRRARLLDAAERAYDDLAAVKAFWA